ncbi:MAG: YdcH family protein [Zavarzinia sp.]|nr:YdcH family protein [Zavarzinia sp.]
MSLEARAASLSQRHALIDRELEAESHRPMPDPTVITKLKREKLRLKDELNRLSPN